MLGFSEEISKKIGHEKVKTGSISLPRVFDHSMGDEGQLLRLIIQQTWGIGSTGTTWPCPQGTVSQLGKGDENSSKYIQ